MTQAPAQETHPELAAAQDALQSSNVQRRTAKGLRNRATKNGGPKAIGLSHIELELSEMKADCKIGQALVQVCRILVSVSQLTKRDVQRLSAAISIAAKHDAKGDGYRAINMIADESFKPITREEFAILHNVAIKYDHKNAKRPEGHTRQIQQASGQASKFVM